MPDQPTPETELLRAAYAASNPRDIDAALVLMTPDIEWPRVFKGGFFFPLLSHVEDHQRTELVEVCLSAVGGDGNLLRRAGSDCYSCWRRAMENQPPAGHHRGFPTE